MVKDTLGTTFYAAMEVLKMERLPLDKPLATSPELRGAI